MPELRKDPIIGRWVIISTERTRRPMDYKPVPEEAPEGPCPFCPGNEAATPPEILAYREPGSAPNGPGWQVRVIANKFPTLKVEGQVDKTGEGLYDKMNGVGAHEVIIESPDHERSLADQETGQIEKVLAAFVARMHDLKKDVRLQYLMVFKNHGFRAGASLQHGHSQLIATPIVPKAIKEEMYGARDHFRYKERCIFCDIVRQELDDRRRLVTENDEFLSIVPFAARFPFETWILPKRHNPSFEDCQPHQVPHLAAILKETLTRMNLSVSHPPYNFVIHTSPCNQPGPEWFHWHIEIMPRITRVAGFERGTGFYINPTPPEEAAQYLRQVAVP
ncbi:MAG TPA: galactose-1-phosphate uridylyltransferase [candidate division Zixibacteria bacterium]|jgi:UDPglucose--hexose-1-phosphate uridylyltransferase|nr:galactose-1-phosphate uridylyltransferase [candidate division Zixibacteria bacterium]